MHEVVDLDKYFINRYFDDNFLEFLSVKKREYSKTYTLNINDNKLSQLYNICLKLHRDADDKLKLCENLVRSMNSIAETESKWIMYPLYQVGKQLIKQCGDDVSDLENCGRLIHRSFNICLNDRNPVEHENRGIGSFSFANLEFLIYHKLDNRDMIKNLVKVLQSRSKDTLEAVREVEYKGHIVRYYYYMGEYYGCYESDFSKGYTFLYAALLECKREYTNQIEKILMLLIPFSMLYNKWYINEEVLNGLLGSSDTGSVLGGIFAPIIKSYKTGNLELFDAEFQKNELYFLNNGTYVALSMIRELVALKFIKRCCKIIGGTKTIVSLKSIAAVYKKNSITTKMLKSLNKKKSKVKSNKQVTEEEQFDDLLDEIECILANLINKGYIKGYLSHSNRCLVLSKNDAFPTLSNPRLTV